MSEVPKTNRSIFNKSQREWRRTIVQRLKAKLGWYCHGCESPDVGLLHTTDSFLELVIPDRGNPIYDKYGNNTVTIYSQILQSKIPIEEVTLLCRDCKYQMKSGE